MKLLNKKGRIELETLIALIIIIFVAVLIILGVSGKLALLFGKSDQLGESADPDAVNTCECNTKCISNADGVTLCEQGMTCGIGSYCYGECDDEHRCIEK